MVEVIEVESKEKIAMNKGVAPALPKNGYSA
jgi:hypothetical protein